MRECNISELYLVASFCHRLGAHTDVQESSQAGQIAEQQASCAYIVKTSCLFICVHSCFLWQELKEVKDMCAAAP